MKDKKFHLKIVYSSDTLAVFSWQSVSIVIAIAGNLRNRRACKAIVSINVTMKIPT